MIKSYVKEKVMKIMKKNEVFVSVEFSACLLDSLFGYDCDVV